MTGRSESRLFREAGASTLEAALRRYFRRRVPLHEVEDLVQDVHLRLHSRRATGEIEDIERYIFVIARNLLSRRSRAPDRSTTQLPEEWDGRSDLTPERIVLGRDWLGRAQDVIAGLPPRTRQIFVLHRFEDMTYGNIARSLGISVSAVEKHIITALKALHSARDGEA